MWTKDQSDNPRRWYALLVFAVLQAGDYLSTRLALASPSHVHPLLLAVMASFGWGMVAMISCLTLFKK
jgi:hypothetical protein